MGQQPFDVPVHSFNKQGLWHSLHLSGGAKNSVLRLLEDTN
jgi:hypothetical protein